MDLTERESLSFERTNVLFAIYAEVRSVLAEIVYNKLLYEYLKKNIEFIAICYNRILFISIFYFFLFSHYYIFITDSSFNPSRFMFNFFYRFMIYCKNILLSPFFLVFFYN